MADLRLPPANIKKRKVQQARVWLSRVLDYGEICETGLDFFELLSQLGVLLLGLGTGVALADQGGPAFFELAFKAFTPAFGGCETPLEVN